MLGPVVRLSFLRQWRGHVNVGNFVHKAHTIRRLFCAGILRDILVDYKYEINQDWTKTNAFGHEYSEKGFGDNISPPRPVEKLTAPYVIVSNIPNPPDRTGFFEHMSRAGPVKKITYISRRKRISRDQPAPVVSGIVRYRDMKSAANALTTLHCTRHDGNIIWVKEFHPKPEYVEAAAYEDKAVAEERDEMSRGGRDWL